MGRAKCIWKKKIVNQIITVFDFIDDGRHQKRDHAGVELGVEQSKENDCEAAAP